MRRSWLLIHRFFSLISYLLFGKLQMNYHSVLIRSLTEKYNLLHSAINNK